GGQAMTAMSGRGGLGSRQYAYPAISDDRARHDVRLARPNRARVLLGADDLAPIGAQLDRRARQTAAAALGGRARSRDVHGVRDDDRGRLRAGRTRRAPLRSGLERRDRWGPRALLRGVQVGLWPR